MEEAEMATKKNKPTKKAAKKGKKLSSKKELSKAQTLMGIRNLRTPSSF